MITSITNGVQRHLHSAAEERDPEQRAL